MAYKKSTPRQIRAQVKKLHKQGLRPEDISRKIGRKGWTADAVREVCGLATAPALEAEVVVPVEAEAMGREQWLLSRIAYYQRTQVTWGDYLDTLAGTKDSAHCQRVATTIAIAHDKEKDCWRELHDLRASGRGSVTVRADWSDIVVIEEERLDDPSVQDGCPPLLDAKAS